MDITPVEILGLVGGCMGAFSSLPQTIRILKYKKTDAISLTTYVLLVGSYVLWLIYGIIMDSISITFWNVIAILMGGSVLYLKLTTKEDADTPAE